jgi:integrase/recombinase XerD
MAGKKGIDAARTLRHRDNRGGNAPMQEVYPQEPGTLGGYLEPYLDYMGMLNRTPKAIKSRMKEVVYFLRWAHERDLTRPDQITYPVLQGYQRWLWRYRKPDGKPLTVSSQRGRLGGVKGFFSWLCKEHVLEANPASDLELPRSEKRLLGDSMTIPEIEAVLAVPDVADPLGIRDRAIIELLYSTGIRRTECAVIALDELNRNKRILRVHGKGNKDRVVPVGTRALAWVEKYIDDVRPLLVIDPSEKTLFLTCYGQGFNEEVLGRTVRGYMLKAGITHRPVGCHLIRHTCATHMLEGGADIRYIQELLGHEKLETTAIYTQVTIEQLKAVHTKTHPAEKRAAGLDDGLSSDASPGL